MCQYLQLGDGEEVCKQFDDFLDGPGPERGRYPLRYWAALSDEHPDKFAFAKTAWVILQIPASESAAERAFSVFEGLFPRCRMGSSLPLLGAELRVRLEQVYDLEAVRILREWETARAKRSSESQT
jgi:hypothetical protein